MGKLDRVFAAIERKQSSRQNFKQRAETLLSDFASHLEEQRPDLAAQLSPAFEQVHNAQRELAHLLGVVYKQLATALEQLRDVDHIGTDVGKFLDDALKAQFEPFADRVLEILKAARVDAVEPDQEPEQWRFTVNRDSEGLIEEVIAVRQTDLDERLESIDEIVSH